MPYGEAGRALGVHPNSLRYAAATGTVLIRWEGARQPAIWTVPPPETSPRDARLELARRYLHIYGPATPGSFGKWAGIGPRPAASAFEALGRSLTPVRPPLGRRGLVMPEDVPLGTLPRRHRRAAGLTLEELAETASRLLPGPGQRPWRPEPAGLSRGPSASS